ncbi:putative aminohydrolase SsnA [[Enterobacter] lignolyticus]|uniref:Chlorohydrolase n=1 Tax=[Enterobacter] lignolyticus TaxID=1334193 RepID=A0A806X9J5_9ENTR|nr:putative aminohydrolase SsnA [[Enterobacter] lignolyticus]ALR76283.1 chlorohydrolase [[Enterobacter] lignolyticus]
MSMLILKNVTAVQLYPANVAENVDIAIEGDEIRDVGPALSQRYPQARVKEMHGRLVMPGIVCSHNHFYSGLSRGIQANIAPCPDFISTLKNLWWRLDRALDEESLYYSGLICAMEAIRSGCTAVIDHHASPNYIAGSLSQLRNAFLKVGLRGMTCFETTDRNGGLKELQAGVEENIRFAQEIDAAREKGHEPWLVEAHIGAHAPFTVPDEGLAMLREALKATDRGLHIHAAEDRYDVSHSHHHYGKDLLARLAEFDLIDSKTLIAHGLYLSDDDIRLLNERDGFLVHNARSNMNNHVGYNHRLPEIRNLALGTDGIGSDMFEEMKFAFFKHRDAGGPLWPDSFAKALSNGNGLLSRNFHAKFGRLEPGYKADLTICDYAAPTPLIANNVAGHIAFGMGSGSVHSVMVNGVMVYEDRQFAFDCDPIYAEAKKVAARLWQRMDALN